MKAFVLVAGLLAAVPCGAQTSVQYAACQQKAGTQHEMTMCAVDEAARADAEMNAVYRALLSSAKEPEAGPKIEAAQKAWIAYRDAYLEAMYPAENKQTQYGTIYPMNLNLVRAQMTRRQTTALRQLLQRLSARRAA